MNLVELNVNRISYSQSQNGAYALILEEIDGKRKLPIVIGGFEAQSIAIALDKEIQPPRPLTHDLFKSLAINYEIKIKQVIIHKLVDGIFYSSIICKRDNEEEIFDARTSDAIALALRFDSPIFTYDKMLNKAGIILKKEVSEKKTEKKFDESLKGLSIKDLNKKISDAIENENYELAAKLRDEINQRK
tara:strand:- start:325 stop:891 length:567 start_codon:yes stop_codon:yes gene_type:complete